MTRMADTAYATNSSVSHLHVRRYFYSLKLFTKVNKRECLCLSLFLLSSVCLFVSLSLVMEENGPEDKMPEKEAVVMVTSREKDLQETCGGINTDDLVGHRGESLEGCRIQ